MDLITDAEQLKGWMPINVKWHGEDPTIDWCRVDDERFTEPFFSDTIERVLRRPFNLMFRLETDVDALKVAATALETITPTGFIFHISRCGSTLVSRMLGSLAQNVVMSESPPLDWMIRADVRRPGVTEDQNIAWIRWMVAALAQKRSPEAEHFFVKFDGWHTLYFDLIEKAFPDVPWIFLYRDPVEVLVSHERQRGAGTVPGMVEHRIDGFSLADALNAPLEEYPARVLGRMMEAGLAMKGRGRGMFVNYAKLPGIMTAGILDHFGVSYPAEDIAALESAGRKDAKQPSLKFVPDAATKQTEATDEIRHYAEKYMTDAYRGLEAAARGER